MSHRIDLDHIPFRFHFYVYHTILCIPFSHFSLNRLCILPLPVTSYAFFPDSSHSQTPPNFASFWFNFRRYLCRSFHFRSFFRCRFCCILTILNLVHVFSSPLFPSPDRTGFLLFLSFRCYFLPFLPIFLSHTTPPLPPINTTPQLRHQSPFRRPPPLRRTPNRLI